MMIWYLCHLLPLCFTSLHHEHNSEGLNLWPQWQPDQVLKLVALTWKLYCSTLHELCFWWAELFTKRISAVWEDRGWWKHVRLLEDSKVKCVQDSCWTHKHNRILINFSPASHFYFIHFLWNGLETESCCCLSVKNVFLSEELLLHLTAALNLSHQVTFHL